MISFILAPAGTLSSDGVNRCSRNWIVYSGSAASKATELDRDNSANNIFMDMVSVTQMITLLISICNCNFPVQPAANELHVTSNRDLCITDGLGTSFG